mmetsp:Transcript_37226/g.77284  ORF Transcript_37226/g.77284 Transcript_37226/m.77284 type:complete len:124 (-) Transcript_37226:162-533(-)|eukprot:CAMPEP_0172438992 /NCGR_PEP_ID=MMETSP1065-20121228/107_1 /TAXON_ID=265537 /ORGANISM="Amphiprora paludosa, Strain CCMP125" /LENGTH=123 /DNA_ID=CAMNT_0013187603 /DNA_START=103 /DNA_END=474 /DNA_ORIENTATION=-
MTENKEDPVNAMIEKAKPIIAKLGFGSLVGYCSGMALKKIGKAVAFIIGVGFMGIQGAVSAGYIEVDWNKVKDDAIAQVDTNGDGTLDAEDVKTYWAKVKTVLMNGIPDAGGFSLGFLYGIKA